MENNFNANKSFGFTAPHSIYYKGTDIMEYCWNRLTYCDEVDVNKILANAKNILIPESITIGRFMEIINMLRRDKFGNSFMAYTPINSEDCDDCDESDDCENMSMDDFFGEDDAINDCETCEDKDDCKDCEDCGFRNYCEDEGVIYDKCCSDPSVYCDELCSHITLADLNAFFSTLIFKSDDSNNSTRLGFDPFGFDPFDANDSLNRMLDSLDDTDFDDTESDDDIFGDSFEVEGTFENSDEYDEVMDDLLNDYAL